MVKLKNPFAVSRIPETVFNIFAETSKRENVILVYIEFYGLRNKPYISLSDEEISRRTGIPLRTVKRSVKRLKDAGLIQAKFNRTHTRRMVTLAQSNSEKYFLLPLLVQYDNRLKYKASKLLYAVLYSMQQKQSKILKDKHQELEPPYIETSNTELANKTHYSSRWIRELRDDLKQHGYFEEIQKQDGKGVTLLLSYLSVVQEKIDTDTTLIDQHLKLLTLVLNGPRSNISQFNLGTEWPSVFKRSELSGTRLGSEWPSHLGSEWHTNRYNNRERINININKDRGKNATTHADPNFESLLCPVSEPNPNIQIPTSNDMPPKREQDTPISKDELNKLDYETKYPIHDLNQINKEAEQEDQKNSLSNNLTKVSNLLDELTPSKPQKEAKSIDTAKSGSEGTNKSNDSKQDTTEHESKYPTYSPIDKDSLINQSFYLTKIIRKNINSATTIAKTNAYLQSNQDSLKAILQDGYTLDDLEVIIQHIASDEANFDIKKIIHDTKKGCYDDLLNTSLQG